MSARNYFIFLSSFLIVGGVFAQKSRTDRSTPVSEEGILESATPAVPTEAPIANAIAVMTADESVGAFRNFLKQRGKHNLAHFAGPVSIVGDYDLKTNIKDDFPSAGPAFTRNYYGSYFLEINGQLARDLDSPGQSKVKAIKDLQYRLGEYDGKSAVGLRFLPIVNRFDAGRDGLVYPVAGETADKIPLLGSQVVDRILFEGHYGPGAFDTIGEPTEEPKTRNPLELEAAIKNENIREAKLDREKPIFAVLGYTHPQYWTGGLGDVASETFYKTQGGMGHMAAYIGYGRTRNAPQRLYEDAWGVKVGAEAEPATLYSVRMKSNTANKEFEDQASYNQNLRITLLILNDGVKFPADYGRDKFVAVNLKEVLAFYRGWLDSQWLREDIYSPEELARIKTLKESSVPAHQAEYKKYLFNYKLRKDPAWANYCAEHITMVLNLGSNLLHNEESYRDVYGAEVGDRLWVLAQERYKSIMLASLGEGADPELLKIPVVKKGSFSPLWEGQRFGIGPLAKYLHKVEGEGPVYDRKGRAMTAADGTVTYRNSPSTQGLALVWQPQTTADILAAFVSTYVAWQDVGSVLSSAVVMNFAPVAKDRMGIKVEKFLEVAVPIVVAMNWYEVPLRHPQAMASVDTLKAHFKSLLEGNGTPANPGLMGILKSGPFYNDAAMAKMAVEALQAEFDKNSSDKSLAQLKTVDRRLSAISVIAEKKSTLSILYKAYVEDFLEKARQVKVVEQEANPDEWKPEVIQYNTPPAIIQHLINGLHRGNGRMVFTADGTVVHASMVVANKDPSLQEQKSIETQYGIETLTQREASAGLR